MSGITLYNSFGMKERASPSVIENNEDYKKETRISPRQCVRENFTGRKT